MGVKGKHYILLLFCLPIILPQHVAVVNCTQHSKTAAAAASNASETADNWYRRSYFYYRTSNEWIQIVGNYKEVDIEENLDNLMVIGNFNTIRIKTNVGDISMIGNTIALRIVNNEGRLKYTGNGARICLGKGSKEQMVDFIGNDNILEIANC